MTARESPFPKSSWATSTSLFPATEVSQDSNHQFRALRLRMHTLEYGVLKPVRGRGVAESLLCATGAVMVFGPDFDKVNSSTCNDRMLAGEPRSSIAYGL